MNIYEYITSNNTLTEADYEYLKSHGSLVYGADHNSPPYDMSMKTLDNMRVYPLIISAPSLWNLVSTLNINPSCGKKLLINLKMAKSTFVICILQKNVERTFYFLYPYIINGGSFNKKTNPSIKKIEDLESKRISGNAGDYVFEYVKENFDQVEALEASDLNQAIELLLEGKVDAVLGDESVMNYLIDKTN